MAIDIFAEKLLTMSQAQRRFPTTPGYHTLRRWAEEGVNGTRLERVLIGKRWFTSLEAYKRFVERSQPQEV